MPITISIPDQVSKFVNDNAPDAAKGPLSSLFGNNYTKTNFRYPADLGSNPARKHSIVFTVKKAIPPSAGDLAGVGTALSSAASNVSGATTDVLNKQGQAALDKLGAAGKDLGTAITPFTKTAVNRTNGSTIALYIPDSVNVSYSNAYDSDVSLSKSLGTPYFLAQGAASLIDAFKNQGDMTVSGMASTVANDPYARSALAGVAGKLTGTDLSRLAVNQLGKAQNPQLQVLFRGVDFRQFQFDFVFTPYSEAESKTIKEIIKTFKMAAAPKITSNGVFSQGLFLEIPETFDIDFYYGSSINYNVPKIGECVITDITVDYSPNGWSTFNDGSPTQIKMTLKLQETVIVDKTRIENEGF